MIKDRLSPKEFAEEIEATVRRRGLSYIEAVLEYCEKNDLDVEAVPSMLNSSLKQKLESAFIDLHFLPKSNKLKFK